MRIEQFDPAADADSTRACHEIYLAGQPLDDPLGPAMSFRPFARWLRYGWTEDPQEVWLARDDAGVAIGWYMIALPERENRHLAYLHLYVHPSRRRAGVGTELVRHAAGRARLAGRKVLSGDALEEGAGPGFVGALGGRVGLAEIRRVLEVGSVPAGLRSEAAPAALAYSALCWSGATPEEHLAGIAAVNGAMIDAPHSDGVEPQVWDADRVRQGDRRAEADGSRYYSLAARSLATGELAGLTQVVLDPEQPEWGIQSITAVTRPHRGHRLGLMLKIAMLDLLAEREPQLKRIITGNADGNEHMIAINEKLGFKVLDRWPGLELDVG